MKLSNGDINKVIAILSSLPCSGLSGEEIENIVQFMNSFDGIKKAIKEIIDSEVSTEEKNNKLIELTNKDAEVSVFLLPSILEKLSNSDITVSDYLILKSICHGEI